MRTLKSLLAALAFVTAASAAAADPKTYQVTGPVVDVKNDVITVMKGKEKWEIGAGGQDTSALKPGTQVTIQYRMTAASIEAKGAKAGTAETGKGATKGAAGAEKGGKAAGTKK